MSSPSSPNHPKNLEYYVPGVLFIVFCCFLYLCSPSRKIIRTKRSERNSNSNSDTSHVEIDNMEDLESRASSDDVSEYDSSDDSTGIARGDGKSNANANANAGDTRDNTKQDARDITTTIVP
jgi:hypothetical protein